MNKPDLTEILNEEIGYLVDTMKDSMEYIGGIYALNGSQISEMEKDFIARLAFSAIKYGVNKEKEEDCESCPAKDHCSFKESERSNKPEELPHYVVKALSFIKDYCKNHECDNCPFSSAAGLFCHLNNTPCDWEV